MNPSPNTIPESVSLEEYRHAIHLLDDAYRLLERGTRLHDIPETADEMREMIRSCP
jgi:hypothetical protein